MVKIPCTKGKFAMVDVEDANDILSHKWFAQLNKRTWYAKTNVWDGMKFKTMAMHRMILKAKDGEICDHINGNGLDNTRKNLRIVTHRQNCQNLHVKKTSQYPGVNWNKSTASWEAKVMIDGKHVYLGRYEKEYDAFSAYKSTLQKYGEVVNE